jgi:serine/threonine protein phosphatase PrpC
MAGSYSARPASYLQSQAAPPAAAVAAARPPQQLQSAAVEYDDGEEAPPRVWLATADIPGLAMSRSLGDVVAHSVGVTSEPEMHHLLIPAEMTWLIFASDGLWEFMSNDEVVAMTAKAPSVGKAIDALITEATDRWMRKEQIVDDTTVVIVEFESAKK